MAASVDEPPAERNPAASGRRARPFSLRSGRRDAAIVLSLAPGGYTVQVRGADGGTGEALVEIYEVDP